MLVVLGIGVTVGLLALASSGCIVPLQFEEQRDAGVDDNFPPIILTAVPAMPGPLTIDTSLEPETITLQLEDKDLDDTLFVRVFRSYDLEPAPAKADRMVAPTGSLVRGTSFNTAGWCLGAGPGQSFTFEVLVADRDFLDLQEEPLYRALPDGAESSRSFWVGICQ